MLLVSFLTPPSPALLGIGKRSPRLLHVLQRAQSMDLLCSLGSCILASVMGTTSSFPLVGDGKQAPTSRETRKTRGKGSELGSLEVSRCRLFTSLSLSTPAAGRQTFPSFSFYLLSLAENCHPCSKVLVISAGKAAAAPASSFPGLELTSIPAPRLRNLPFSCPDGYQSMASTQDRQPNPIS